MPSGETNVTCVATTVPQEVAFHRSLHFTGGCSSEEVAVQRRLQFTGGYRAEEVAVHRRLQCTGGCSAQEVAVHRNQLAVEWTLVRA